MRFAYYQGLSRADQRAYDESDRRRTVPLTELNHAFDLMLKGEVKRSVVVYP